MIIIAIVIIVIMIIMVTTMIIMVVIILTITIAIAMLIMMTYHFSGELRKLFFFKASVRNIGPDQQFQDTLMIYFILFFTQYITKRQLLDCFSL